ncbi:unnamed protein product [Cylicocyclus nassatus]|uniref:Gag protein n=1 Tax=Cylicocyclus nassatus TaxID=53992 RepID=A0AA36HC72_CYLNA|nr:unnamed protein product [Cylicocyclus nassatus]
MKTFRKAPNGKQFTYIPMISDWKLFIYKEICRSTPNLESTFNVMSTALNLKTVKQKLTRLLNTLSTLLREAEEYQEPWQFPTEVKELQHFLLMKSITLKNLYKRLEEQKEKVWKTYEEYTSRIYDMLIDADKKELGTVTEMEFNSYWEEKKEDDLLQLTTDLFSKLESRLFEIEFQEASLKLELLGSNRNELQNEIRTNALRPETVNLRHLLGGIKIPELNGKASEFDSFWEIFEEMVDKQPYSNIEKFSILLDSCKGDAARALRMFPRTSESYEKAIQQLKTQFQDPKRIIMMVISQLKAMRQCKDEPRALRNNLNDVQAIIATLRKNGEMVDTTNMISMVLEKFSKTVQDEVLRKEFDSGIDWNMEDLLKNISAIVRRQEHLEGLKDPTEKSNELPIFQLRATITCTGCGRNHLFQYCPIYRTVEEKNERLKSSKACWKCFSKKQSTRDCYKPNCPACHGLHNIIICKTSRNETNTTRNSYHRAQSPRRENSLTRMRGAGDTQRRFRDKSPKPRLEGKNSKPESPSRPRMSRVRFARSPTPPRQNRDFPLSQEENNERSRLMIVPTRIFNNSNKEIADITPESKVEEMNIANNYTGITRNHVERLSPKIRLLVMRGGKPFEREVYMHDREHMQL